jgi:hypothetical protein
MVVYSPEYLVYVRRMVEDTDAPLSAVARDCGISESTLYRMQKREGWVSRVQRPRGLPFAKALLDGATTLANARVVESLSAAGFTEDDMTDAAAGAPVSAAQAPDAQAPHARLVTEAPRAAHLSSSAIGPLTAERLARLVEREIAAEEAVRDHLGNTPRASGDAGRTARTLATLAQTLQMLMRLRCGAAPDPGPDDDDIPRDIDEFRRELARRIEAVVASQAEPGDAGCDPTAVVDRVRS